MSTRLILIAALICLAGPALAQTATPVVSDSRIKTFVYNESDVYSILTHYGYQSNIEFGKHETVSTVSVGDRVGWQIVPAGHRLFIKPMEENSHTNMTVVTNKRAYQFDLRSTGQIPNYPSQELVYVVRFFYPDENPMGAQPPIFSDASPAAMPDMASYNQAVPVSPVSAMSNMPMMPQSPAPMAMAAAAPSYPAMPSMPVMPQSPAPMPEFGAPPPTGLPSLSGLVEDPSMLPGYSAMPPQPVSSQPMNSMAPAATLPPQQSLAMAAYPPAAAAPPAPASLPAGAMGQTSGANYNYTFSGSEKDAPIKIYDDGKATYFTFQPGGKAKPKFYKMDAKGKELPVASMLNQSGELVVNGISPRFTIRHNGANITVFNENALSKQTM